MCVCKTSKLQNKVKNKRNMDQIVKVLKSRVGDSKVKCTHMQRLFCHHQHPVLCVSPHVLVHVQRSHRHVDPTSQELHLQIQQKTFRHVPTLNPNANTQRGNVAITCPAPSSLQRSIAKARSIAANTASASSV